MFNSSAVNLSTLSANSTERKVPTQMSAHWRVRRRTRHGRAGPRRRHSRRGEKRRARDAGGDGVADRARLNQLRAHPRRGDTLASQQARKVDVVRRRDGV